jgi:galactokinase
MKTEIIKQHKSIFNETPDKTYFLPGVIPLAGEHIEEAGGQALLLAVEQGVYLTISETSATGITIYDTLFQSKTAYPLLTHPLDDALPHEDKIIHALFNKLNKERGTTDKSFNITVMPVLDDYNSFHLEQAKLLLITIALNDVLEWNFTKEKIIKYTNDVYLNQLRTISHKTTMMTMLYHQPNRVMHINAKHNSYDAILFPFKDYHFYVFNPTKPQDNQFLLCKSHQRTIREAEDFFERLRSIATLCDLDLDFFNQHKRGLNDEKTIRYTEHIFYEHARINQLIDTLNDGDMDWFEEYINESQASLKDLFDINYDDITFLVDTTMQNGAIAARSINKGCHKSVIAIFKNPLDDSLQASFKERFTILYNAKLIIVSITLNTIPLNP